MLRLIRQFIADNIPRLAAQLAQLEQNVDTETRSIRASFLPGLEPVSANGSNPMRTYSVGQAVECDMTIGSYELVLTKPQTSGQKGLLAVVKLAPANSVTVRPVAPMKINGHPAKVYATPFQVLALIYFDGTNFYG